MSHLVNHDTEGLGEGQKAPIIQLTAVALARQEQGRVRVLGEPLEPPQDEAARVGRGAGVAWVLGAVGLCVIPDSTKSV